MRDPGNDILSAPIKGVLFDVDGTLYHQGPLRIVMILLLVAANLFRPRELMRKQKVILRYRESQEILRDLPDIEAVDRDSQVVLTSRKTGEPVSYVSEVIGEWFEGRPIPFLRLCKRRGLEESVTFLKKKGLRLGVFSDYPAERKLRALGISDSFGAVISLDDRRVHGFKPRSNGFEVAAADMGLSPSEVLYVGDRPEVDGEGASRAGMQVVIMRGFLKGKGDCAYPSVRCFRELLNAIG